MPRLSLRTKLLAGVLLLLLPVLGLLLWGVRDDYERRRDMVLDRQVTIAESIAALVDALFDDGIDLGLALANDPVVRSFDPTLADPHLQRLARHYPQYIDIEVFNANGDSVGASFAYAPGEPRLTVATLPHFQRTMATGQPTLSPVFQSIRWRGKPLVSIHVPLLADGRAIGTVSPAFDPGSLPPRLASVRLQPGDAIMVIDPQGRIAFHSLRPDLSWEERDRSRLPEVQAALAGQVVRTDSHRSPTLGDLRAVGFVRSPKHGWVVAASSPTAVVFAPIEEALRRNLAAFGLITLLGLAVAWWLSIYLAGPLGRLAALAEALGRGELGQRAEVRTGDEIEQLGQAFNTMAARLQETMGRLQALFGSLVEAVYVADARGRLIDANPAGLALAGLRPEDLHRPIAEYADRLDFRRADGTRLRLEEVLLTRVLGGATCTGCEVWFRRLSGDDRLASVSAVPVRDEQGRVILAVAVVRDITEERLQERARLGLARVAQQIAATLDIDQALATAVKELVASFDVALARVWLWDEAEQVLVLRASAGLSTSTAATGSRYGRLQLGQLKVGTIAATRRPLSSNDLLQEPWLGEPEWAQEERIVAFAGFPLLVAERLLGVLGLFSRRPLDDDDLTALATIADQLAVAIEKARLGNQLRQRVADLEEERVRRTTLLNVVAHELRGPMTVLKGYASILRQWERLPEERREHTLGTMGEQVRRLDRMLSDLLDVARIGAGRLPIEPSRFDLVELAKQVVAEQQATTTKHRLVIEAPAEPVVGTWDRDRIAQVLTNLLSNAIKYSPEGGEVRVQIRRTAAEAEVSVHDQGTGLAREELGLLFQPYSRLYRERAVKGLGLGLYISKGIVEGHGGHIWAESPGPGLGSTFRFILPLALSNNSQLDRAAGTKGDC